MTAAGIIGLFFATVISIYIFRRWRRGAGGRLAWLIVLLTVSIWLMKFQLQTPAEAIHFFQYGILSFFLFRACTHHMRDWLVYPTSLLLLIMIASGDEFLQWLMPGRFWDFRDIRLNLLAGIVVQSFIALVIRPSGIRFTTEPKSVRRLCYIAWSTIFMLALAFSNTPSRVDLYATRIPFLQFLSNNESVMSEFGYEHFDVEIGTFYSRYTMQELLKIDRTRGREVGEIINKYKSLMDYHEFLRTFTLAQDPFLHELRVHIFRRDHYSSMADHFRNRDTEQFVYHVTVAYRENQILEKFFPMALIASKQVLSEELYQYIRGNADLSMPYTSSVSSHLVTVATENEFRLVVVVLVVVVGLVYARYGRERSQPLQ